MRRQRQTEGFNLSFLDIMSCGLGAVILVLILLKLQPSDSPVDLDTLRADLLSLKEQRAELQQKLSATDEQKKQVDDAIRRLEQETQDREQAIDQLSGKTEERLAELESLKKRIEERPPLKKKDVVEVQAQGEEDYLLGLKVEGRRIVILVDTSASMTDEALIDIIRRKSGPAAQKQQGPKWKRTMRVVKWLVNRAPANSDVSVIGFNNKSQPIGPSGWSKGQDAGAVAAIFSDLENVVPTQATNLQQGLVAARKLSPQPTNYYVITDGLPTAGNSNYRSLNPFASCSALFGKSNNISGECRVKVFRQTLNESAPKGKRPVNVILLPLEGDPEAAPEFWAWTWISGGLLITPAESWP